MKKNNRKLKKLNLTANLKQFKASCPPAIIILQYYDKWPITAL